jgi:hypothetical protein
MGKRAQPGSTFLGWQEDRVMTEFIHANFPTREPGIQSYLLFGAIYPFSVAAESFSRLFGRVSDSDEPPRAAQRSVFAEARTNASIASSYLLMARAMLH